MNQYMDVFIEEGREHLQHLNAKMLELEANPEDLAVVNDIFRSAHTLKGMAGSMGFDVMVDLTHKMENVLDAFRNGQSGVTTVAIDVLFEAVDHLEAMVEQITNGESDMPCVSATVHKLKELENGQPSSEEKSQKQNVTNKGTDISDFERAAVDQAIERGWQVYHIMVTLDEGCLLKAARALMVFNAIEEIGEIIKSEPGTTRLEEGDFDIAFSLLFVTQKDSDTIKGKILNVSEVVSVDLIGIGAGGEEAEKKAVDKNNKSKTSGSKTIRVNLARLDHLLNLFEELIIDRGQLEKISQSMDHTELKESVDKMMRVSNQLQETILNLRMEPIEHVFNRFPRMVRSLSKELNKMVNLVITGADTEIDRTVIDEIGDPIVHLLRNSLDHGIETPQLRRVQGKDEEGKIILRAFHSGNYVYIEIEDDGGGINKETILTKAIEKGVIAEADRQQLSESDIFDLMFASGFSTADYISDISGRGVGLDVVKSKIVSLGGRVTVKSELNEGTTFTIKLPLTLSIINAMMIRVGNESYAIPISSIVETALLRQVKRRHINKREFMTFRNKVIPVIDLCKHLCVPNSSARPVNKGAVIITNNGKGLTALIADELLGHQDIVIKPLGNYLGSVKGISGATITGDGKVALILDCQTIE
ncbi:chemotaxis protein CheA [Scopulibacillus darangshiensis]